MKSLRVRRWLKLHPVQDIVLSHEDYKRFGYKTTMKIVKMGPSHGKLVSIHSQDFNYLSGAGKPGTVFSNNAKAMMK